MDGTDPAADSRTNEDVDDSGTAHPPLREDDISLTTDDEAQRTDLTVKPENS